MAKVSRKAMMEALNDRFYLLEMTDGINMYDKTKHGTQSYNGAWVANISILNGCYVYRDKEYKTVEQLVEAVEAYNATLPFNPEYYNPTYRKNVFISLCCTDYMKELGLKRTWAGSGDSDVYVYADPQDPNKNMFSIEVRTDDMKETGKVMKWHSDSSWSEIEFDGLDAAIAAINSMLSIDALIQASSAVKILGAMTSARYDGEMVHKQFNTKTLQIYTTNERDHLIELLEKELENLKKMK